MRPLKLLLLTFLCLNFSYKSFSQYYYDEHSFYTVFGFGIGAMNCITDIGGANQDKTYYINEIRSKNFKFSGTAYATLMYEDIVGLRLSGTLGSVASADKDVKATGTSLNIETKNLRNLSFRSSIAEASLMAEFHPLSLLHNYYDDDDHQHRFSPYILAGIGMFHFNPQTEYNGSIIDLQPLHTEGEGFTEYPNVKNYKLTQFNVPLGIGVQYELSSSFLLSLEYIHRVTFTDYLDDASSRKYINPNLFSKYLSPIDAAYANALYNRRADGKTPARRGNPNNNDTYMNLTLKLGIIFGRLIDR